MTDNMQLENHFLIAMPGLDDIIFFQSVIYICEHKSSGSVGLIINRPLMYQLEMVFEQLNIVMNSQERIKDPLLFGGPLQPNRGFVMHRPEGHWKSSLSMRSPELAITTSNDILVSMANNTGPKESLVALGYVGWESKQLEQEILNNAWLVCPFKSDILYNVPFSDRWLAAGLSLGVNMNSLVSREGHA